jgi:superfamily II DNA or RNA helicase
MSQENWIKLEHFFPAYSLPKEDDEDLPNMFKYYKNNDYYNTINLKKEFTSLKLGQFETKPEKGTPLKNQDYARKFMHPVTPYEKLLIFQGLGTGKTCLSVFVYEFARKFLLNEDPDYPMKKALVIVRGPNSKKNFIRELANVCTTGEYIPKNVEIKQKDSDEKLYRKFTPQQRYNRTLNLVRKNYQVETFIKFATELSKMTPERKRKMFSNTYIIIDEVHNLRYQPKKTKVSLYEQFHDLLHIVENTKILLLSATPMRDRPEELVDILNLLLPINKQLKSEKFKSEFLDKEGQLIDKKKGTLADYFKGYISYVRSMESTVQRIFMGDILPPMKNIFVMTHQMHDFQERAYMQAWDKEKEKSIDAINDADDDDLGETEDEDTGGEGDKQGLYEKSRQASLIAFPDGSYGKEGLSKYVKIDKRNLAHLTPAFQNELLKYGDSSEQKLKALAEYSDKYAYIINEIITHPDEKIFIYSSFVKGGGALMIGALLEFFSFSHIETDNLFSANLLEDEETTEEKTLNIQEEENVIDKLSKNKNRFCIITGTNLSPYVSDNLINRVYNNRQNTTGDYLRIIIGSHVVGEGLSFKCVRQLHVVTPHWNNSVTEQAIGRGIRAFSHDDLPENERYIKIFRHASIPKNKNNSIDLKMYKLSEDKDIRIKSIERVMKESAVDCLNNRARNIRLDIDKDGSRACDYQECDYECRFVDEDVLKQLSPIEDTNNLYYADGDVAYIISKLREVFYEKDSVDLKDLLSLFYDKTTFVVLRALKKVIDENIPIKSKSSNINYLRENKNLYFLVSSLEYPSNFLLSGYASLPIFKLEKNLKQIISVKEPEMIFQYIQEIDDLDYDENQDSADVRKRIFFIFRKLFSNETREMFLEQFYLASLDGVEKNKKLRKKFLSFYKNYLIEVDDKIVSFYNQRFGGTLRYLEDGEWKDATDDIVEGFEKARADLRKELDENKYGYYGILAENQASDLAFDSEIGIYKYKIFAIKKDRKIAEATGKVDKRMYREFNPGTECGTGKVFNKEGLIKMMSSIFVKLLNKGKALPDVPLLGGAKAKRSLQDLKANKNFSHLDDSAKEYINENELTEKQIQTFATLLETTKDALCTLSKDWFVKNNLIFYY